MKLPNTLWTCVAILLGFLVLSHLGVMLCFLTSHRALPWVIPVSLLLALWIGNRLGRSQGLLGKERLIPLGVSLGLTIVSVIISVQFYGLSWDGQWYHQPAIYFMVEGWNPLSSPMHSFPDDIHLWIRHYAKGSWYPAAAMMSTTGIIESGMFVTWLALGAAFMAILAACLDFGIKRGRAITLSALVALNPVAVVQMVTFMVDGLMICYLAIYGAVLWRCIRQANKSTLYVGLCAVILCINAKLTGLVFLCFVTAGFGCYCLWRRRDLLVRFIALNLGAILLAVLAFGYNPYVTNTLHRHHPFYPCLGTEAYPSLTAQGREGIELYETPKNMLEKNRVMRHAMALFGQPGNQPYNDGPDALPMWPFAVPLKKLWVYSTHEARVAGFGPFFSGGLILSLLLAVVLLITSKARWYLLLAYGTIIASLLVSLHTWWPRYGPQMWWIPILPIFICFWQGQCSLLVKAAWVLTCILLINALAVGVIHMKWEIMATRTLQRQFTELRDNDHEIEVCFMWFGETFSRRLKDWDIPYREVPRREVRESPDLMSVVAGYPGRVQYRPIPKPLTIENEQ